jgi:hypothetical protein
MSPHCSAIFLQHSCSAAVIAALGNAHAITGNAANNIAKRENPDFANGSQHNQSSSDSQLDATSEKTS